MISDQVHLELRAERFYLACATVASNQGYGDFGDCVFREEAKEESWHARRFTDLLQEEEAILGQPGAAADVAPADITAAVTEAEQLEREVGDHIRALYAAALAENATYVISFLSSKRHGYNPLIEQQKAISKWRNLRKRLADVGLEKVVAAFES
jgi:ferritin